MPHAQLSPKLEEGSIDRQGSLQKIAAVVVPYSGCHLLNVIDEKTCKM